MKKLALILLLFVAGCSNRPLLGIYKKYPLPAVMAQAEIDSYNLVESRLPGVKAKWGIRGFANPKLVIVRSPDQIVDVGIYGKRKWKDVPDVTGLHEAVPGEGFSGLWLVSAAPPTIFVSTIGGRDFHALYAHERAHTCRERGTGHDALFKKIEVFLRDGKE